MPWALIMPTVMGYDLTVPGAGSTECLAARGRPRIFYYAEETMPSIKDAINALLNEFESTGKSLDYIYGYMNALAVLREMDKGDQQG